MSGQDASAWRNRVNDVFEKRRQTPQDAARNLSAMSKKLSAVRPIRLPKLQATPVKEILADAAPMRNVRVRPGMEFENFEATMFDAKGAVSGRDKTQEFSPQRPPGKPSSRPGTGSLRPVRPLSGGKGQTALLAQLKQEKFRALMTHPNGIPDDQEYKAVPRDPNELYLAQRSQLDTLPLELFDFEETDRTPEQWVTFGGPDGTPAMSRFFQVLAFPIPTQYPRTCMALGTFVACLWFSFHVIRSVCWIAAIFCFVACGGCAGPCVDLEAMQGYFLQSRLQTLCHCV
jgi:hypothetical protein